MLPNPLLPHNKLVVGLLEIPETLESLSSVSRFQIVQSALWCIHWQLAGTTNRCTHCNRVFLRYDDQTFSHLFLESRWVRVGFVFVAEVEDEKKSPYPIGRRRCVNYL